RAHAGRARHRRPRQGRWQQPGVLPDGRPYRAGHASLRLRPAAALFEFGVTRDCRQPRAVAAAALRAPGPGSHHPPPRPPRAQAKGPLAVTTVAGASGTVYASTGSLYVAATAWQSPWSDSSGPSTQIYKFALNGNAVPLDAVGMVAGTVLNSFAMDEDAGFF